MPTEASDQFAGAVPTQADIARLTGVSRGLVSLALADSPKVASDTKERILTAAKTLGYSRNLGAASLAARRSELIGILLPDMHNPFFGAIVEAIQKHGEEESLIPLVVTAANNQSREEMLLQRFRQLRVSGVAAISPATPHEKLQTFGAHLPLVVIGRTVIGGNVDVVHTDEDEAASLVVTHALARGYQRVVKLSPPLSVEPLIDIRHDAYTAAMIARGLTPEIYHTGDDTSGTIEQLLADRPQTKTAIWTHNDLLAIDAIAAVRGLGLTPGVDVGIVGFDDTYLAKRAEFDMTSVDQQADLLGKRAVTLLEERAAGPVGEGRETVIQPRLSVRSSC